MANKEALLKRRPVNTPLANAKSQTGVSLLEFILGLVILAIVLAGVSLFSLGHAQRLDPVFQFRAVSLAEALVEQVWSVKYDEHNNPSLQQRCGINAPEPPECLNQPSASEPKLSQFRSVDDFQWWCEAKPPGAAINGHTLAEQLALPQPQLYQRFTVDVCVDKPTELTVASGSQQAVKPVTITVNMGHSGQLSFRLLRANIR